MSEKSKNKTTRQAVNRIRHHNTTNSADVAASLLHGDVAALSQAITWVESTAAAHITQADEVLALCLPHSGNSLRVGITGVPGVGKSTFIDALGTHITGTGKKCAVLAVDPSSRISGGSILGDKTRMEKLSLNPMAFIRPTPSASRLGGVAGKTREVMMLCEAAGYDVILIETVGVGQSETVVHGMTDFFLLLTLAGAGDQLQGIKRGIIEMCDALLINKADGDNEQKAKRAAAEYIGALHLFPPSASGWQPQVSTISSLTGSGIAECWQMILQHQQWHTERNLFTQKRDSQNEQWFAETFEHELKQHLYNNTGNREKMQQAMQHVKSKAMTPREAARWIVQGG
ncbi:MAG: methylmalonyl Co-A mutase-associated GTPase MeaB [Flavobacteriales bacterium]